MLKTCMFRFKLAATNRAPHWRICEFSSRKEFSHCTALPSWFTCIAPLLVGVRAIALEGCEPSPPHFNIECHSCDTLLQIEWAELSFRKANWAWNSWAKAWGKLPVSKQWRLDVVFFRWWFGGLWSRVLNYSTSRRAAGWCMGFRKKFVRFRGDADFV